MDDDVFLKKITFPDLKKKYRNESKSVCKEKEKEFKQNFEILKEKHYSKIHTCRAHDEIVNLCIHPFTEYSLPSRKLGYRFIRADPLFEFGLKNVDFLLYKPDEKTPIAIFGEVKTIVTNKRKLLKELDDCHKAIKANIDFIKNKYLKTDSDPILEFVLAVPTSYSIEARDAIQDNQKEIILWLTDLYQFKLKLGQPRKEDGKQRMLHHDPELNKVLKRTVPSLKKAFDCFPQSHMERKLKLLLECIEYTKHSRTITRRNLNKKIQYQLFYLDKTQQKAESDLIIKEAIDIDFLRPSKDNPDRYHILSRSVKKRTLEEELTNRWIKSRINAERKEAIDLSVERLQKEIFEEQHRRPTLF